MTDLRWTVWYRNGRTLAQHDSAAPEFRVLPEHPHGGEIPSGAIDWSQVVTVEFTSDAGVGQRWEWQDPGPAYRVELRRRTMVHRGLPLSWFVLVQYYADRVIDPRESRTLEAATATVWYWFPDGYQHRCTAFNCPEMDQYAYEWLQRSWATEGA